MKGHVTQIVYQHTYLFRPNFWSLTNFASGSSSTSPTSEALPLVSFAPWNQPEPQLSKIAALLACPRVFMPHSWPTL
jgi:hypothetical protein